MTSCPFHIFHVLFGIACFVFAVWIEQGNFISAKAWTKNTLNTLNNSKIVDTRNCLVAFAVVGDAALLDIALLSGMDGTNPKINRKCDDDIICVHALYAIKIRPDCFHHECLKVFKKRRRTNFYHKWTNNALNTAFKTAGLIK